MLTSATHCGCTVETGWVASVCLLRKCYTWFGFHEYLTTMIQRWAKKSVQKHTHSFIVLRLQNLRIHLWSEPLIMHLIASVACFSLELSRWILRHHCTVQRHATGCASVTWCIVCAVHSCKLTGSRPQKTFYWRHAWADSMTPYMATCAMMYAFATELTKRIM